MKILVAVGSEIKLYHPSFPVGVVTGLDIASNRVVVEVKGWGVAIFNLVGSAWDLSHRFKSMPFVAL